MSDGRVITAHLFFTLITALIPGLIFNHWIAYAAGAAVAIAWWVIAAIFGDGILMKTLGAEPLNVSKYSEAAKLVKSMRIDTRNGPPSMWMIWNTSPMILSVGLSRRRSHLICTQGFFDRIEDKAQVGLIYREFEAIRQGLTSANTGLATLLWIILLPGRIGTRMSGKAPGEPNLLSTLFNLLPAFLVGYPTGLLGANRHRVYVVDYATLRKLENADYLPFGLMRLQEAVLLSPFDCDLALSGCCIMNPHNRDPYQNLFRLHPPTPKRIDRLRIRANAERRKFKN